MKAIAKALSIFHKEMQPVGKDRENPFFKSRYATLDNILEKIKGPLEKAGLTFIQIPKGNDELMTAIIEIESGELIEGTLKITPVKNDPQSQGSAITYARRYALSAMLGISTDDDDDGHVATLATKPPVMTKICSECKQPHTGQYAKCLECFKKGKQVT